MAMTEEGRLAEDGTISVLIVDDQEIIREAFGALIAQDPSITLVGALGDGVEAVEMTPRLKPDVVVMDFKMPRLNGVAAAKQIRAESPGIGIILLSAYDEPEQVQEFFRDDPEGKAYLLKHTLGTVDDLVRTIHDVAAGRTVLDPLVVDMLTSIAGAVEDSPLNDLTKRELEVLSLMAGASSNATIASALCIRRRTVEHHINGIYVKLGIGPESGQHARIHAVLAYLKAAGPSSPLPPVDR
jgi:DNA-binding NarL/FixJ family response regulator